MSNPEYPLRLTTDREKQLLELTQKSYDVDFLTREDLLLVIKNRLALLPLTDLGRACLEDMYDRLLVCGRERLAQFYCSLSALKAEIEKNRDRQNPIGYITGGLEGFHHVVLLEGLVVSRVGSMIIGLEDPSYISSKGRSPIFSLEEKNFTLDVFGTNK